MDLNSTIILKSAEETQKLGQTVAALVSRGDLPRVLCLYGELGSGKTTFTQGFARGLGVTTRLLSPTFIIVRRYTLAKDFAFFYHADLYRLESDTELAALGIAEMLVDRQACVAIEWAERLGIYSPNTRLDIHFSAKEDGAHAVDIKNMYEH